MKALFQKPHQAYLGLFIFLGAVQLSGAAMAAPDPVADLFVSPRGNDRWTGRLSEPNAEGTDGPVASLEGARVRLPLRRKQIGSAGRPLVVALRGGTYPLSATQCFGTGDGGTPAAPIVYQAFSGETPVISGGKTISGWTIGPSGRWWVVLADVKSGQWNFSQLFVNGHRRRRPSLPRDGYFHIAERILPPSGGPARGDDRFRFSGDDIRAGWENRDSIEVTAFHAWCVSVLRIADVNVASKIVTFTGPTLSGADYGHLAAGMRYRLENVAESLATAGEWYLDRTTGMLTYIPLAGETPENVTVIAPRIKSLVEIGTLDAAPSGAVSNLRFEGLTFAHSNDTVPAEGLSIGQAAESLPAAVQVNRGTDVEFRGCTVTQGGTYGLGIGARCDGIIVEGCRFIDLGAGGIKVGTAILPAGAGDVTRNVTIRDNTIAHVGRMHPSAVGIWIGHAADVNVAHNDIYDLYYTGVSTGWSWGYNHTVNRNIRICENDIHHLGQGVLSDMGGVYTLGISPDSLIEGNRIHDIRRVAYGGWGIYFDEGSTGYAARNNLLYRIHDGGFAQHYGIGNIFENNVLLNALDFQWRPSNLAAPAAGAVAPLAFAFERNIISGWAGPSVVHPLQIDQLTRETSSQMRVRRNVYWNADKPVRFGPLTFEQWQARGFDAQSVVVDPNLPPDPDSPGFRVPDNSPGVRAAGFVPFDISKAGRLPREPADLDPARWPPAFPPAN